MAKWVVGIDPGKKGAIAFVSLDALDVEVYDMPRMVEDVIELLEGKANEILRVFIERQQPFPRQGIVSSGNLMRHYGELLGIVKTLRLSHEVVSPKKWQKVMIGNGKKRRKKSKRLSIEKARQLFPHAKLDGKDGRSDALLIAEFGRRQFVKEVCHE